MNGVAVSGGGSARQRTVIAPIVEGVEMPSAIPVPEVGIRLDRGRVSRSVQVTKVKEAVITAVSERVGLPR